MDTDIHETISSEEEIFIYKPNVPEGFLESNDCYKAEPHVRFVRPWVNAPCKQ